MGNLGLSYGKNISEELFVLAQNPKVVMLIVFVVIVAFIISIVKKAIKLALVFLVVAFMASSGMGQYLLLGGNSLKIHNDKTITLNNVGIDLRGIETIETNTSLKSIVIRYTEGSSIAVPISSNIEGVKKLTEFLVKDFTEKEEK